MPNHRVTNRPDPVRIWIDRLLCSGACVGEIDHATLRIGINQPRFLQIRHGEKPVAARHRVPVDLSIPLRGERLTGAAPVAVVLQAAAHHVRLLHVVVNVIELRKREGVHHFECLRAVVTHLPPAVGSAQHTLGV